jgi:hypothetical protein
MSSAPPALFRNGAIFFSEELAFNTERRILFVKTPPVFNNDFNDAAIASEEGAAALRPEPVVFKKVPIFLRGTTRASDEEVSIFRKAVLASKDADSALIEDPIFYCNEAIGAGFAAASGCSAWAASI